MHSEFRESAVSRRRSAVADRRGRRQRRDVSGDDQPRLRAESAYKGPIKLDGDPKGASVLILGAGLAGMTAALELRKAGYKVQVLEFNSRPGGRNWTLRGGDSFTELGGATQTCEFEQGHYINPGPWRIPYHHHAMLDYCKRLGVALEPFIQLNHNALLHATKAFGGKPQRIREIKADFQGHVSELLAKVDAAGQARRGGDEGGSGDPAAGAEVMGRARRQLRLQGQSDLRGNSRLMPRIPAADLAPRRCRASRSGCRDILQSRLWRYCRISRCYEFQTTMFQPVGGMDMIGKAFAREVGDLIRYNAKVTQIQQDEAASPSPMWTPKSPATPQQATADWCICTIPLSVLSQIRSTSAPA